MKSDIITVSKVNPPSQFEFNTGHPLNTWFLRINEQGIHFNREVFPNSQATDFAAAFIEILEKEFDVSFVKREKIADGQSKENNEI